jgi:hypothetical protein
MPKNSSQSQVSISKSFLILALVGTAAVSFYVGSNSQWGMKHSTVVPTKQPASTPTVEFWTPSPSPSATPNLTQAKTTTPSPASRGASLETIKYTLPSSWGAQVVTDVPGWKAGSYEDVLYLSSKGKSGGAITITAYNFDESQGRREFFCQTMIGCMDGTTHFTPTKIGNMSGYLAGNLDASATGPVYFGNVGNKFYIIIVQQPMGDAPDFENNYQNVFNSLKF